MAQMITNDNPPVTREALIRGLLELLPADRIITDQEELFVYESDGFTIAKARPAAVVFPVTTAEVVQIVNLLGKHGARDRWRAIDDRLVIDLFEAHAPEAFISARRAVSGSRRTAAQTA